ncbi:hypothetical protein BGZ61DRAFT_466593, partial [Ilyonectria robusta]|uniref:uncharacterized protein n=1 Tax=Ilyonectria robusta TaxID=1079257 RepID=UPI001E8D531B
MAGVPEAQIRRAGRWNMGDSMIGCCLTLLPYAFMRASAELIQKAIPAIAEKVRGVEAGIYSLKKTVETEVLSLKAEVTRLKDEIQERNKAEITIVTTISPFGRTHCQTVRYEQQEGIPTSSQQRHFSSPETRAPAATRAPTAITTITELPPQIGFPRKWRLRNERQLFSTRKRIVTEVVSRSQANGWSEDESARQLDEERGQRSLDWLFKQL